MINLKTFVVGMAKDKKISLLPVTGNRVRDVEREMENNRKELMSSETRTKVLEEAFDDLKNINELRAKFDGDDWRAIKKELDRMR